MEGKILKAVEEAKNKLRPEEREIKLLKSVAETALEAASKAIAGHKVKGEVHLGGSYAHGTWLKGEADIDVFIRLDPSIDMEKGFTIALDAARKANAEKIEVKYAEHPYVGAIIQKIAVEFVPCYNVEPGRWRSAADRSVYHTQYLKSKLNDTLRDEIRLTKAFMKAQGVYGAEIKVRGFSGYLAEILTLSYGSFLKLLEAATNWRKGEVITPEPLALDVRKLHRDAHIIVPDPVDQKRNLAAAVSYPSLGRFILAAEKFLGDPSVDYFVKGKISVGSLNATLLAENLSALVFEKPEKPEDVLWGEILKTIKGLTKYLARKGFNVVRVAAAEDSYTVSIVMLVENLTCCTLNVRRGPRVLMPEPRRDFLAARKKEEEIVWVGEDGRLYSLAPRTITTIADALEEFLRSPVKTAGAAKGLESVLTSTGRVFMGWEVIGGGYKSLWNSVQAVSRGDY